MKIKIYIITVLLCFSFILASNVWSQELVKGYYDPENDWFVFEWDRSHYGKTTTIDDPLNKVNPIIKAKVFLDNKNQEYIYSYEVTNQHGAKQHLMDIVVKYFAPIYDPMVPIPIKDWYMARFLGREGSWRWAKTGGKPSGIPPGQTESGLSFKSKGLPTIVDSFFLGHERTEYEYSPPGDLDTEDVIASFSRVHKKLKEQYKDKFASVVRKTVGPKAPPTPFVPTDFLNYIISLKHESYNLGWIVQGRDDDKGKKEDEDKGIMKSLDKKLEKAKAELVKGDTKEAIEKLKSFIHEVEALYKEDKEEKHKKEKEEHSRITSEAYALLKYNAVYLIEQLGGVIKDEKD